MLDSDVARGDGVTTCRPHADKRGWGRRTGIFADVFYGIPLTQSSECTLLHYQNMTVNKFQLVNTCMMFPTK